MCRPTSVTSIACHQSYFLKLGSTSVTCQHLRLLASSTPHFGRFCTTASGTVSAAFARPHLVLFRLAAVSWDRFLASSSIVRSSTA
jgi:hypothetical protein